jgi:hypothetical protein
MRRGTGTARAGRTLLWTGAASAALLLTGAASASAGTLDQQQTAADDDFSLQSSQSGAQTFTPAITGALDQVDLLLLKAGTPPGPSVTVEIRELAGGGPGATPLATASIPASSAGATADFLSFSFATPASVTAGTQYAIVVYSPAASSSNAVEWRVRTSDVYSGGVALTDPIDTIPPGSAWVPAAGDFAFKTYVAPPTPSSPEPPSSNPASTPTGQQAAALNKCKRKHKRALSKKREHDALTKPVKQKLGKQFKKCKRKARRLPI